MARSTRVAFGGTRHGNSNTLASNLNSRVIQMVITKNLTLAQAWGILDLARTNSTGNVTAFPFVATSEFYTLGFVDEVNSLVANTSVVNGGNTSVAPPPTSWQLFWNTIAGWAERAWSAVLAVGAFFAAVGRWLEVGRLESSRRAPPRSLRLDLEVPAPRPSSAGPA